MKKKQEKLEKRGKVNKELKEEPQGILAAKERKPVIKKGS